jgi:hypothetical protein
MERFSGTSAVMADLDRLYRAAERAGYVLGCIDVDEPAGFSSHRPTAMTYMQFWMSVLGLSAVFLML